MSRALHHSEMLEQDSSEVVQPNWANWEKVLRDVTTIPMVTLAELQMSWVRVDGGPRRWNLLALRQSVPTVEEEMKLQQKSKPDPQLTLRLQTRKWPSATAGTTLQPSQTGTQARDYIIEKRAGT